MTAGAAASLLHSSAPMSPACRLAYYDHRYDDYHDDDYHDDYDDNDNDDDVICLHTCLSID